MNRRRMVELLQGLVRIDSVNPPGNEIKVAQYIYEFGLAHGLESELHRVDEQRLNVTVTLKGKDTQSKKIYFNGHLDTVPVGELPWTDDPFGAEISNGRVFGRGTSDMKGGVAALLEAMVSLKENGIELDQDIVFIGTVGEEVDCLGAKAAVNSGLLENPGAMIIAEPSDLQVYVAHKGALWIEISTYGKTAHGSMAHKGINAIDSMVHLINRLRELHVDGEDELLGEMSCSLNTVIGGVATNVVPDQCTIQLDFRTINASQNKVIPDAIALIIEELSEEISDFAAKFSIIHNLEPLTNKNESGFLSGLQELNHQMYGSSRRNQGANYYTDASVFRKYTDVPIVIYGAGEPGLAHQPNESVSIENLEKSVAFYMEAVQVYEKSARAVVSES